MGGKEVWAEEIGELFVTGQAVTNSLFLPHTMGECVKHTSV